MSRKKTSFQQEVRRDVSVALEDAIASGATSAPSILPARQAMSDAPAMSSIEDAQQCACAFLCFPPKVYVMWCCSFTPRILSWDGIMIDCLIFYVSQLFPNRIKTSCAYNMALTSRKTSNRPIAWAHKRRKLLYDA